MDATASQLLVFDLGVQRYALPLETVERVIAVAEVTSLPRAPTIVLGVLNVGGTIVAVLDVRSRFGLPSHEPKLSDHMVIARTRKRAVALVADEVLGVVEYSQASITAAGRIFQNVEYVAGVVKLENGLIFIHDLDTFLSPDEEGALGRALAPA